MFDFSQLASAADISRIQARDRPDSIALDFRDRLTTYAELDLRANQVAQGLLALGAAPGARIGYLGKNCDRYFEGLLGAFKARAVIVGVNWRLAPPEIAYVLNDAGCEALFVGRDFAEEAAKVLAECPRLKKVIAVDGGHDVWPSYESWRDRQSVTDPMLPAPPNDDVIQLYTSGTTGHPKGAVITNANYLSIFRCLGAAPLGQYEPDEAVLVAMPIFHVAGVNIGLLALAQGARAVVLGETDPAEILRLIAAKSIAHAFLVPALILFMLQHPNARTTDFSSLKNISYGASPISDEVLLRARETFGCGFLQVYGLTETTGGGTLLMPEDHAPDRGKLRSCGRPAPGHEIRVVGGEGRPLPPGEVGEIQIRAGNVMKGYWNNPDATAKAVCAERWFSTGDAGFFDAEGYLYIHDRVKDMIVSGGENVYPAEVENALMGHPAVADVAVIGVPDERWGEAVKAIVVKKPGLEPTPADIIAYARARIAGYKLPKSVDFIEALPRNPSGKVLRKDLRRPYWEGRDRQVN
ncbi:MAG TPA: long-chain-fatty-acid--CoA ligase [Rhizomicrobium sp.]|nr:long-chain-fatty-acid--CoA ligase [Rhizomicrobium sp.]